MLSLAFDKRIFRNIFTILGSIEGDIDYFTPNMSINFIHTKLIQLFKLDLRL